VAHVLAAVAGLVIVAGYVGAVVVAVHRVTGEHVEPSRRPAGWPRGSPRG
jgi:hypothetical protein